MSELRSWAEIGAMLDPPVSGSVARKIGERALRKLRAALEREGVTVEVIRAYFHLRDSTAGAYHDNIAALTPPVAPTRDDADPKSVQSLRRL